MHSSVFTEISIVIVIAAIVSIVMRALRQPLIIGYILTGVFLGPTVFNVLNPSDSIDLLGNFGVALLLFLVGLGLNPKVIKEVGRVSLLTGLGQVLFTLILALGVTKLFGYSIVPSLYIAVALTFSSTIIILKLLTDKREHNTLYGKISIGFLLVQDIIATFALVIASASGQELNAAALSILILKGIVLTAGVLLASKYIISRLSNFLSKSQELLFIFSIAWGFSIATLFYEMGFSLEVGALIAGVALSTMHYAQEIGSRLRPLRDFFIVVFFIALGARLDLGNVTSIIPQVIAFSTLVLIGNPLIVMMIMGVLGYTKKTGFKAGLAVAQISEFSLIFILLGLKNKQIDESVVSLVAIVGIITIAVSAYMITYADKLFALLSRYLQVFERKDVKIEKESSASYDCVLFGYRRGGSEFVKAFDALSHRYLVVDYNPETVEELERKNIPYVYGDVTDPELLDDLDLAKAKLVVCHVSDFTANSLLVEYMQNINAKAVVICRADNAHEAAELYGLGASYVLLPRYIGSERIGTFIRQKGFKKAAYAKYRDKHQQQLQELFETEEQSGAS